VELARIRRQGQDAPIADAQDATHPAPNEIDRRFRREVGAAPQKAVTLAVCYAGKSTDTGHGQGASHLARALRHGDRWVWVDDGVPLAPGLEAYTLVYLVGQDTFQLDRDEMNALYAYLQAGGTILVESCRHGTDGGDPAADAAFADLLASMGVQLEPLPTDHSLLVEPFLFAAPPPGFEAEGSPEVRLGGGVIFSTFDYGCLWRGERRGRAASREEIRTAMEWGANLVAYAAARRSQASAGSESG